MVCEVHGSYQRHMELPIIAMTASVTKQDIERALDSGMNDHIAKPIPPDTLFNTLSKWIK